MSRDHWATWHVRNEDRLQLLAASRRDDVTEREETRLGIDVEWLGSHESSRCIVARERSIPAERPCRGSWNIISSIAPPHPASGDTPHYVIGKLILIDIDDIRKLTELETGRGHKSRRWLGRQSKQYGINNDLWPGKSARRLRPIGSFMFTHIHHWCRISIHLFK